MTANCKKLIEVALPIKEISAESVRDKSIRHGHISTLHLWWARRPLPVCRAVVFASLVPDPLDENCPQAFKDAVEILLGSKEKPLQDGVVNRYKPYEDIPWTAVFDPVEDNHRNRLQAFIGKFSAPMQEYLLGKSKKQPGAKDQLSDDSLIKWDNKNNEVIIGKARQLIFVAHNATSGKSATELLAEFDTLYGAIKTAEQNLYDTLNRHIATEEVKKQEAALETAKEAFLNKMPKVFDPFAGGGAIPLEAARLGCRSYGNDINPVAHIIQKGSLEFPQKYGKPISFTKEAFLEIYDQKTWEELDGQWLSFTDGEPTGVSIPNRLSFDVEFYAKKLLSMSEKEIGHLYPSRIVYDTKSKKDKEVKPIAYSWVRVGTCSNPSCRAKVPLLKQFYLSNKSNKQIYLKPVIAGNEINFSIENGICELEGFVQNRKSLMCPCCGNLTENRELKSQFLNKETTERLLCVIEEGENGKSYRLPTPTEFTIDLPKSEQRFSPSEVLAKENTKQFDLCGWGFYTFGDLFTKRQLALINNLCDNLKNISLDFNDVYHRAILTLLSIVIDKVLSRCTSFGIWHNKNESLEHPFGRQAIPMVFDFPEANIFSDVGSGSFLKNLNTILRYIDSESFEFSSNCINSSSGDLEQFESREITSVVTDPPYYDAIAYADLSDFFYVWLKRNLNSIYPLNFAFPQTPKTEECTALRYRHNNSLEKSKEHFENKLLQIFKALEHQTSDLVSIMFAHQSTEAWTTLINSILYANMNVSSSWAIDTEQKSALKTNKAFLSSSVTVSARPSQKEGYGDYKEVKKSIEKTVETEVALLYSLGFRGADLLTGCFGQAVSEFGKYASVEKADGSEVTVAELLEMARESAFNALLKGFDGDDFTKFYIGWLQLYGFAESDFDDAAKFSRVGLTINVQELFTEHILIQNGNKQTLGGFKERIALSKTLGEKADSHLINQVHRGMLLYIGTNRPALLAYIAAHGHSQETGFWRVITSLCELLPKDDKKDSDYAAANGLLVNRDSLIRESKASAPNIGVQGGLFE